MHRKGGARSGYDTTLAKMCPSRWLTPIRGLSQARASALAAITPTSSDPISPGPDVTAISPISSRGSFTPARRSASSVRGRKASRCLRAANSGTTPPNGA